MKFLLEVLLLSLTAFSSTESRERALQEKIVASCCWNESIAFHRSETAAEMRAELKLLIDQGLGDQQILERFKSKYSARVLIEPEGGASVLIYSVPAVALVLGAVALAFLIRHWLARRQLSINH